MNVVGIDDKVTVARGRIFGFAGQLTFWLQGKSNRLVWAFRAKICCFNVTCPFLLIILLWSMSRVGTRHSSSAIEMRTLVRWQHCAAIRTWAPMLFLSGGWMNLRIVRIWLYDGNNRYYSYVWALSFKNPSSYGMFWRRTCSEAFLLTYRIPLGTRGALVQN